MKKQLYEILEEAFDKLKMPEKYDFKILLKEPKKSKEFLVGFLKEPLFQKKYTYNVSLIESRARHSLICCLLGYYIINIFNISFEMIQVENFSAIWMLTSLYHDVGYFSRDIGNINLVFSETFSPCLLHDIEMFPCIQTNVMEHTVQDIINYDKYARDFHVNGKHEEVVDHGILGGMIAYENMNKKKSQI